MSQAEAFRIANAEVKAGIFLAFCLALFFLMLVVYGRFNRAWADRRQLNVVFNGVPELKAGAPVRFNGMEIGRVETIGLLILNEESLARFPLLLGDEDLERLPLTENECWALRRDIDGFSPEATDQRIRAALTGRTMVKLTLDVLLEHDPKRYRLDDRITVTGTLMGDSWVEISSGSGPVLRADYDKFLLGVSMDVGGDLSDSLDSVNDILSAAGETIGGGYAVVGLRAKITRFDQFVAELETVSDDWDRRLKQTWDETDRQLDEIGCRLHAPLTKIPAWREEAVKGLGEMQKTFDDWRKNIAFKADEGSKRIVELRRDLAERLERLMRSSENWKAVWPERLREWLELSTRFNDYADRGDVLLAEIGQAMKDNAEELRGTVRSWAVAAEDLDEKFWYLANRPWNFANQPETQEEAAKFDLIRRLDVAARHYRELREELRKAVRKAKPVEDADREKIRQIEAMMVELDGMEDFAGKLTGRMKALTGEAVEFAPSSKEAKPDRKREKEPRRK
jgi:hypothetical protein